MLEVGWPGLNTHTFAMVWVTWQNVGPEPTLLGACGLPALAQSSGTQMQVMPICYHVRYRAGVVPVALLLLQSTVSTYPSP